MSRLVDFYRGDATDIEGRWLSEILAWDDEEFELVHDFIQWLFPLEEPSRFNPDAPLLTATDRAELQCDPVIRENLLKSYSRILTFLGLSRNDAGGIDEGPNFSRRADDVWQSPNHNWLRITRILRSLYLVGLEAEARQLYARLDAIYTSRRFPITAETFGYWTEAIR